MIGTVIFCLIAILVLSVFAWAALSALYGAVRRPLILRYGEKFRIVKTTKLTRDDWNEKDSLEERYRLEVYTLGIWMMYERRLTPATCENDIEQIKKWRVLRAQEKESSKKKEVIKEDVL